MAILHNDRALQKNSHWYRENATPCHWLPKASGDGERAVTIKDAKQLRLFPSVTSILSIFGKPGLDTWRERQVALKSLEVPIAEGEDPQRWADKVRALAMEQVAEAADLGKGIHGALEAALQGQEWNEEQFGVYVRPVMEWFKEKGLKVECLEKCLVNTRHGYAGTADVLFSFGKHGKGILDYKTRKTKPGEVVKAYDFQGTQLAAYAATFWGEEALPTVLAANVFISTTEPGRVEIVKQPNMDREFQMFVHAAEIWRHIKGYDPRSAVPTVRASSRKAQLESLAAEGDEAAQAELGA